MLILHFIYIVVCSIVKVMIENIKIKTMFNSEAEVNCMFKRLIDVVQLFVRQSIKIIIINVINERANFFNRCKTVFINICSNTISIFIFVVKCSDHKLLLKRFFQCAARMSSININNKSFEMILYSLNKKN